MDPLNLGVPCSDLQPQVTPEAEVGGLERAGNFPFASHTYSSPKSILAGLVIPSPFISQTPLKTALACLVTKFLPIRNKQKCWWNFRELPELQELPPLEAVAHPSLLFLLLVG